MIKVSPLFKWAGGKRKMLERYETELVINKPAAFVDLFGGSGIVSVYFYKKYGVDVFLNELNTDIYQIYYQIKHNYDCFISVVDSLETKYIALDKPARKEMYLALREEYHDTYNETGFDVKTPILFFLMCTNFNGIWQAKTATGIYYTPFGNGNQTTKVYDRVAMSDFKEMVDHATITNLSFEKVTGYPKKSLVFMDPPYINSHTRYDDRNKFGCDLQAISSSFAKALMDNHDVMYCNKNHELFTNLFGEDLIVDFNVTYTGGSKTKMDHEIVATNLKIKQKIDLKLFDV